MKPDWDKLMKKFKKSKTTLVADVDCTAKGEPLCSTHGVQGYPTIKHGDPSALEDYQGGRDYESLEKFAKALKASCSPTNIDLCDDEQKKKIETLQALSKDELATKIKEEEKKIEDAESEFKTEVEKLQKQYQDLSTAKDDAIKAVKDAGLGIMKSVQAAAKKGGDKDEL